tara:strand:- start:474 stop:857 length:384 start_codon:yes stop_codon:yes gene_type:complete
MKKLTIYTDGGSKGNPGPMTIGIVFQEESKVIRKMSKKIGFGTNNQAEYTAVITALDLAYKLKYKDVELRSDSQLLINQLKGEFKVSSKNIIDLFKKVNTLKSKFDKITFKWIPRNENTLADSLSNK